MKTIIRESHRPAPYRKNLAHLTIEELEWRVAAGQLSKAALDWIKMERDMTDEQLTQLRDAGLLGPAGEEKLEENIKRKGDPTTVIEMRVDQPAPAATPVGEYPEALLGAASGLLALVVRPTAEESCRYFLALMYHLQPEQARQWGGLRGMASAIGRSAMTVNLAVKEWEELLGRRATNQKTECERFAINSSRAKETKGGQEEFAFD